MKLIEDTMKEHGEWSLKRILAVIFSVIIIVHALIMITNGPIKEGHELLFGEMVSLVILLMGLSVANKHKALRSTTNREKTQ